MKTSWALCLYFMVVVHCESTAMIPDIINSDDDLLRYLVFTPTYLGYDQQGFENMLASLNQKQFDALPETLKIEQHMFQLAHALLVHRLATNALNKQELDNIKWLESLRAKHLASLEEKKRQVFVQKMIQPFSPIIAIDELNGIEKVLNYLWKRLMITDLDNRSFQECYSNALARAAMLCELHVERHMFCLNALLMERTIGLDKTTVEMQPVITQSIQFLHGAYRKSHERYEQLAERGRQDERETQSALVFIKRGADDHEPCTSIEGNGKPRRSARLAEKRKRKSNNSLCEAKARRY